MRIYQRTIIEIFVLFLIATLAAAFFLVFKPYVIQGTSMEPTLHSGERVLIDKAVYFSTKPRKGEVIAMADPADPDLLYVKRVIAEEGDIVDNGFDGLYVNGQKIREASFRSSRTGKYQISKGYVFVLGDNRAKSYDSRNFGLVPLRNVIGQAKYVVWPLGHFRRID